MISIPFEIDEIHGGLSEAKGVLRLEDEFLVFQVQTITLGMFKQDPELIKIEIAALEEIRFEKKLVSDRIYIRPKKLQLLDVMPGKHGIEVALKIKRKNRTRALILVDAVRREIMNRKLT
ncbi:MAG: hypothetical protein HKN13_02215 [Rhodothermales bacterium]|nr:hypothetical protein [Rhodothermales bacterium]